MTDSEIIDALGGTFKVAELCEVKPPSVSDWRHTGIPNARRMYLRTVWPEIGWPELANTPQFQQTQAATETVAVEGGICIVDKHG